MLLLRKLVSCCHFLVEDHVCSMTLTLMEDIALNRNYWRNMVRLVGAEYKNTIMMLSIILFVGCMKVADALWIACPWMILDVCVAFPQLGFQS